MAFWDFLCSLFKKKTKKKQPVAPALSEDLDLARSEMDNAIANHQPYIKPMKKARGLNSRSKARLRDCHPDIRKIVEIAADEVDLIVVDGSRTKEKQDEYFASGASKVRFPNSYHNTMIKHIKEQHQPLQDQDSYCSLAVDLAPFDGKKIDWNDKKKFLAIANAVKDAAKKHNIPIQWGYDLWKWDMPHFQLTSYRKGK